MSIIIIGIMAVLALFVGFCIFMAGQSYSEMKRAQKKADALKSLKSRLPTLSVDEAEAELKAIEEKY